jgi:hypothetical protein
MTRLQAQKTRKQILNRATYIDTITAANVRTRSMIMKAADDDDFGGELRAKAEREISAPLTPCAAAELRRTQKERAIRREERK